MNYYEDKPRYWRSCALWTEEEVKFLLSGIWPDEGESAPNSLACTVIEIPKVETLCSTNERGIKELLEIHETETVLVCPVPDTVTLSQLIGDAVSAGLLTPVPFAGQVRYAHHLVNKFRPDDVIRWANRRGCFPDFPFCTDYQAVEPNTEPTSQTLLDRQTKDPAAKPGTYEAEPEVPSPQAMTALQAEANVVEAKTMEVVMDNQSGPDGWLSTPQIATVFDGLHFTGELWRRRLSDAKWVSTAKRRAGEQGGAPAMWCPLALAKAIHARASDKKDLLARLNRVFNHNKLLTSHRSEWMEYFQQWYED